MSRTEKQRLADFDAMFAALRAIGAMKEYELAAATGLSEDRIYRAAKHFVKLGRLVRRSDGELRLLTAEEFFAAEAIAKADRVFRAA